MMRTAKISGLNISAIVLAAILLVLPMEATGQSKVNQVGESIELQVNKALSVDLPQGVAKVVLGNEGVADIHLDADTPGKAFVIARTVGTTNAFLMDKDGNVLKQLDIRVNFDNDGIQAALRELLPGQNIKVSIYRDSIFLTGNVRSASESAQALSIVRRFVPATNNVVNMLNIKGSQQVVLQVRVSEIARSIRKNLSVNQQVSQSLSDDKSINFTTSSPAPASGLSAFATGTIITQLTGLGPTNFEVLERQGLVKTLAEPTLTAISGETASFLSGGEFPVPTGTDATGNLAFEFREFGIRLNFTPVVVDQGRINLRIASEISAIDSSTTVSLGTNVTIPSLTQKRTETTIDLPSGGSIMIAGLLEDNVTDTISGVPGLKDLPVLGALFRSSEFQRDETELVVTVTAYLVRPTGSNKQLSLPTDGFEPASDFDQYILGRLHREYTRKERPIWAKPLKGPFGFIME